MERFTLYFAAETARIDPSAHVGAESKIWDHAHIREHARLGHGCVIGEGAYIGAGVQVGNNCKVQNYALVYEPAILADGVFIGPGVVLTNDLYPRATNPDLSPKDASDWEPVGVTLNEGASIGARAVCVAPVTLGRWSMVAAGSVVTTDVADFSLVAGVPARHIRWVGRAGVPLVKDGARWRCPHTGELYELANDQLREATL